jgi:mRNA-degrading endonuclease toxin of MazEF toxin-antitoxin module
MKVIKRGDIFLTTRESGGAGALVVVLSNNAQNQLASRLIAVPVSNAMDIIYHFETEISVNGSRAKVMCDQIRTLPKALLSGKVAELSADEVKAVEYGLKLSLGLDS